MARGAARDRPRSKGSLHDGTQSGDTAQSRASEPHSAENAQRRIRSAENQHRIVTERREAPQLAGNTASAGVAPTLAGSSALDRYPEDQELAEETQDRPQEGDDDDVPPHLRRDVELKRPASRKKDPTSATAAGLGAFAGPARMEGAFEQRKTRQPIPVESWGPRPPSRAGPPPKAGNVDTSLDVDPKVLASSSRGSRGDSGASSSAGVSRPTSKVGGEQAPPCSKVVGGTWASARAEPQRVVNDNRRGRERKAVNRGTPEVAYAPNDLGIFGCGATPSQKLSKSLSGVFDPNSAPSRGSQAAPRQTGQWASNVDAAGALEVNGSSLTDPTSPWPESPAQSCGSPPTRKGRHSLAEAVAVEDVEPDPDLGVLGSNFRRDVPQPQVIVTRSSTNPSTRGQVRRGSDQRRTREQNQRDMPFNTALDADFLRLFAS